MQVRQTLSKIIYLVRHLKKPLMTVDTYCHGTTVVWIPHIINQKYEFTVAGRLEFIRLFRVRSVEYRKNIMSPVNATDNLKPITCRIRSKPLEQHCEEPDETFKYDAFRLYRIFTVHPFFALNVSRLVFISFQEQQTRLVALSICENLYLNCLANT